GVAAETAAWMMAEMRSPEGAFYSSLDADSEGHEGKFYVWSREEVQGLLEADEFQVFARRFGLDGEPNFEGQWWHLHAFRSIEQVAQDTGHTASDVTKLLQSARQKLLQRRNTRVRPGRDEKILTSWNALAIRGLAISARLLERDEFADWATQALDFIRQRSEEHTSELQSREN